MYLNPPDHPKCPGFGLWVYGISRKRHPKRPGFGVAVLENEYPVLVFEYRKRAGISRDNHCMLFWPDGSLARTSFKRFQRCSNAWKSTKYSCIMLKCMKILAYLVHKALYNVLTGCPKVASLHMQSRVRKCLEQYQTYVLMHGKHQHTVDINTMWFGGL